MTPKQQERKDRLLPNGIPRWVRIYIEDDEQITYTVVFTGNYQGRPRGKLTILSMNGIPFHPSHGVAQHTECEHMAEKNKWGFPPAMGRKGSFGRRIHFTDLPLDCQRLVLQDYHEIWRLER